MNEPIWIPSAERVQKAAITRFLHFVNERHGTHFSSYEELHRWSVTDIAAFWGDLWEFLGILASSPFDKVIDDPARMPGAHWFSGARLNFAENLLRYRDNRTA